MKKFFNILFSGFHGFYGILSFLKKCSLFGHQWEVHKVPKKMKFKHITLGNRISEFYKGHLKYRICKTCGKQEISKSIFSKDNWVHTDERPKEIKTYMSKVDLNKTDQKVLEEYISNFNGS